MNIFFVMRDGLIVTPPLGTILPGITRDSVIRLAGDLGHTVEERPYSIDDWRSDAESGALAEAFVCGTAATIVPLGCVRSQSGEFVVADGKAGPVTTLLRESLMNIQHGHDGDSRGWRHAIVLGGLR